MSEHRSIEIDFEIHRRIEMERRGFSEPPLMALRRLLGIGKRPWRSGSVLLPSGTLVRASYNGTEYKGTIVDGKWVVGGNEYSTPSGAAMDNFVTKKGRKTHLNGWGQWEVRRPGDEKWIPLQSLRVTEEELDEIVRKL